MPLTQYQKRVPPVGIDLGTTYSCISYLTPEGQPVTLPNTEGELSTPSIVFFDGDEVVVGTEALRNSVAQPERVVQHAKRHMGDRNKCWVFDGHVYRPKDISALIIRKLLNGAEERLGRIHHAVVTVPAQFSDVQRQLTVEAGLDAGLERVDIINEPVATALCHVLSEGMWFAELADEQTVLVFDLGGGTFDLSLVQYNKDEVRVIASGGDLRLGGLDWNQRIQDFVCDEYTKASHSDPRLDRESMQGLAIEIEQVKRSLSVRPKASIIIQHEGRRKSFLLERDRFEVLTNDLVKRTEEITKGMLKLHNKGWAHVNSVLVTGGASRMPMIRKMLQRISGSTLNTTLSPDQSISHGAAFYAGILLSGQKMGKSSLDQSATERLQKMRQQSVTGRALGILIRDPETDALRPQYLIPANTPLPCAYRQKFGTIVENQKRVHLQIVESGATSGEEYVQVGECLIDRLPDQLPSLSPVEVTIQYDEQGRVQVSAVDLVSGTKVRTTILREEAIASSNRSEVAVSGSTNSGQAVQAVLGKESRADGESPILDPFEADLLRIEEEINPPPPPVSPPSPAHSRSQPVTAPARRTSAGLKKTGAAKPGTPPKIVKSISLEDAERPIPLCNQCGNVLNKVGECADCKRATSRTTAARKKRSGSVSVSAIDPTDPMNSPPASKKGPRHKPR